MTDVKLSSQAVGAILFTLLITSGIFLISSMVKENSSHLDENDPLYTSFEAHLNRTSDIEVVNSKYNESVTSIDTGGATGILDALFGGAWRTIRDFASTFSFMNDVYEQTAIMFHIPIWIFHIINTIITILIVFAVFNLIFNRQV